MPNEREKKLLEEIASLRSELGIEKKARSEAEKSAITAAEMQEYMAGESDERPTGETVTVQRLDHYKTVSYRDDGRPILKPVFKEVQLPTFAYRINMPAVGGLDLKINDVPFYHGATYVLDIDTLRTVKEIVHRLWHHDRQIHGDADENAYRPQKGGVVNARGFG
jgi:hypothetical protein